MLELKIKFRNKQDLTFRKTHYVIDVPIILDKDLRYSVPISFIIDTGAFISVINMRTAKRYKMDLLPVKYRNYPLGGFVGGTTADLIELPQMIIGDRTINEVIVAVPHIPTTQNLLGLNILEHFKYYVDTSEEYIYFADNDNYKIGKEFRSGEIQSVSDVRRHDSAAL